MTRINYMNNMKTHANILLAFNPTDMHVFICIRIY